MTIKASLGVRKHTCIMHPHEGHDIGVESGCKDCHLASYLLETLK